MLTACLVLAGNASAQKADAPQTKEPPVDAGNLRAFIALVRANLKTEETLIIAQNIHFTEDEAFAFWPLHSEYNLALNKLLDERLVWLGDYATTLQGHDRSGFGHEENRC